ncbi:MAG: vWA domain-containing protein [Verrucomicrobiales bacterium]
MKTLPSLVGAGAALALACHFSLTTAAAPDPRPGDPQDPLVQIALLLDTSNSMDGLIEQAKTQLWKIVNEFIGARREGRAPVVQVALYEYGNDRLSATQNYIRQVTPLTRDLDMISRELFSLRTCGGSEFCGAVIQRALEDLAWDQSSQVYKTIFIAGNEPFTQGPVPHRRACQMAIGKGIVVNTIHCGSEQDGLAGQWKAGADVAEGRFLVIDQDRAVVHIPSPVDARIEKLNLELNLTYIPYGKAGGAARQNQFDQDLNADNNRAAGAAVQRIASKASSNYWNAHWDLVDALKQKDFKIEALKAEDLPVELQKMSQDERRSWIEKKSAERAAIQKQILELSEERKRYVTEKARAAAAGTPTLDDAVARTVRAQAEAKGYRFR